MVQLGAAVVLASLLSMVVTRVIELLVKPLFERYGWDKFWLPYASWGVGTALVGLTNINIFFFIDWRFPVVGYILTGIVAGGGATLLYDIVDSLITLAMSFAEIINNSAE
jgi:hypothetical protein